LRLCEDGSRLQQAGFPGEINGRQWQFVLDVLTNCNLGRVPQQDDGIKIFMYLIDEGTEMQHWPALWLPACPRPQCQPALSGQAGKLFVGETVFGLREMYLCSRNVACLDILADDPEMPFDGMIARRSAAPACQAVSCSQ